MSSIKYVTDSSFEVDVMQSSIPVLVEFEASWCGPCKTLDPLLDNLAVKKDKSISVVKVNVDSELKSVAKYAIRGIPTLLLIRNGQVLATKVGSISEAQLNAFIELNL